MQVELREIPLAGTPEMLRRERIYAFLTKCPPQQACPVLDTGKRWALCHRCLPADRQGRFSAACWCIHFLNEILTCGTFLLFDICISMLARVLSSAVFGIDAYVVEVEVDIAQGLPAFATVGLPEGAVKESKDRVKAAVKNCGYDFPARRITVNLAPADIKKEGAAFDLPMAIGILAATEIVQKSKVGSLLHPR